jgi:hypothetical protein
MRALIFLIFVLIVVVGAAGVFAAMQGDVFTPYADAATATDNITAPENSVGAVDGKFTEIPKGGNSQSLLLDMGKDQEGTSDLLIHYKTAGDLEILVQFESGDENGITAIEQHTVSLKADNTHVLVIYDKSPAPYRYVRFFASEDRKYQIDAILAETYRPDSDRDSLPDEWELKYGLNPLDATGRDGPNGDIDLDQLTNKEELSHKTAPIKHDTDEDGLADKWELDHKLDPTRNEGKNGPSGDPDEDGLNNSQEFALGTHPDKKDTDEDETTDSEEVNIYGTDPTNDDSDGDELLDGWEIKFSLDAKNADGENGKDGDPDQDELTNYKELKVETNPWVLDTDEDGIGDADEVRNNTEPNNWDDGDLDKDELINGDETKIFGTDPLRLDTDGDGLPDGWELAKSLNPLDATGHQGAQGDPENDSVPNILEFQKGASPNHPDSELDGLPDSWEIQHCLKPNDGLGDDGPEGDPDNDGKTNFIELGIGESPTINCIP